MFDISYRILHRLPIYTKPTIDYVPMMYPPGFYLLGSFLIILFGEHLWSLRLISFVSSIISGILIFEIIRKITKSPFFSFLGAGIFFGAFKITGFWYDLARVDSLFIMLVLLSLYLIVSWENSLSIITSSFSLSFAFFTKQSGIFFITATIVWLFFFLRKRLPLFLLILIPMCLSITLILDHLSDGWYLYWVYKLPKYQPLLKDKLILFKSDMLKGLPVICGMGIVWIFLFILKRDNIFNFKLLISLFLLSSFIVSLLGRGIEGGVENAIIPFVAISSITTGIAVANFSKKLRLAIYGIVIFQFVIFFYNPAANIPSKMDRICGDKFLKILSSINGDVFLPYHGFYLIKAHKKPCAYTMGLFDVLKDRDNGRAIMDDWTALFKERLEKKGYAAIITSTEGSVSFENFIRIYYKEGGVLFDEEKAFFTIAGWKRRPNYVYIPR